MISDTEKIKKISKIASSWWTSVINNPKMDNGDNSKEGQLCMLLLKMHTQRFNPHELKKFNNELYHIIKNKLITFDDVNILWLDVDDGPNKYLSDAAQNANISCNNFPLKTTMKITKHCVKVRYGYGAEFQTLYADKFYYETEIESCKEAIKDYNSREDCYFDFVSREELVNLQQNKIKQYEIALLQCEE